jgi:hypothetical protein
VPNDLIQFLLEVSSDAERLARYQVDPEGEMESAGLSDEERTALRSGDCSLIRAALHDCSADLLGFVAALLIDSGTNRT